MMRTTLARIRRAKSNNVRGEIEHPRDVERCGLEHGHYGMFYLTFADVIRTPYVNAHAPNCEATFVSPPGLMLQVNYATTGSI